MSNRPPQSRRQSSKAARVSAGTALIVEKGALREMADDVGAAVDSVIAERSRRPADEVKRVALMFAILAAGTLLGRRLARTIASHRQAARDAAAKRLRAELRAAGLQTDAVAARKQLDIDVARATATAQSIAAAWQGTAIASIGRPANDSAPFREIEKTRAIIRPRIERAAQHEVFGAYNAEHAEAVERAIAEDPVLAKAFESHAIVRLWDAVMDRRTCSPCADRDGKPIEPGDEEPPMHIGCRCISTIDSGTAIAGAA